MLAAETELAQPVSEPDNASISVRICRTWDELEEFREQWNILLQANPSSSIFHTPEWLAAWWQAFGRNRSLLCLLFADPHGATVGILPLYADRTHFLGLPLTRLRMVGAGSGDSDGLDFIVYPGHESQCAEAFIGWLAGQKDGHVCELETLPQKSLVAQSLFRRIQEVGWNIDSTLTPNFVVDLPATWPQYLSSLESSFRPLLTRYPKRLRSRFSVKFTRCEKVEDLKERLPMLFDLHQMRWTGRGEVGAFARADRRDFYQRMTVSDATEPGVFRLAVVVCGGRVWANRLPAPTIQQIARERTSCFLNEDMYALDFPSKSISGADEGKLLFTIWHLCREK
jgi:hypothetical protein